MLETVKGLFNIKMLKVFENVINKFTFFTITINKPTPFSDVQSIVKPATFLGFSFFLVLFMLLSLLLLLMLLMLWILFRRTEYRSLDFQTKDLKLRAPRYYQRIKISKKLTLPTSFLKVSLALLVRNWKKDVQCRLVIK